jgi:hypothetical protein
VSSYCYTCVLILLLRSARRDSCPHTTTYVSSYSYTFVLMLLHMCPHTPTCVSSYSYYTARGVTHVLILLHMCPHTATHVSSYSYYAARDVTQKYKCLPAGADECFCGYFGFSGATLFVHTPAYVSIRLHTSAYVSIRQHTSVLRVLRCHSLCVSGATLCVTGATIDVSGAAAERRTCTTRMYIVCQGPLYMCVLYICVRGHYICVRGHYRCVLLYASVSAPVSQVPLALCVGGHTMYVSSSMCPHTTIRLYVCPYTTILLYMCPHAPIYVRARLRRQARQRPCSGTALILP